MMHRLSLLALVVLMGLMTESARAEREVVLVTDQRCPVQTMPMLDVRKAYFGLPVSYGRASVRAYRLNGDAELDRIFHQSVVFMSEKSYEKRLLFMLIKHGSPRPQGFDSVEAVLRAVRSSECGITYVWAEDAARAEGIKVLRLIWQGD